MLPSVRICSGLPPYIQIYIQNTVILEEVQKSIFTEGFLYTCLWTIARNGLLSLDSI